MAKTPHVFNDLEKLRIELVNYIWERLNNHFIPGLLGQALYANIGKELEEKVVSWIMEMRRRLDIRFIAQRLADDPLPGSSGASHKIDDIIYYPNEEESQAYIAECKNIEMRRLKMSVEQGWFPHVGPVAVASLLTKVQDICPHLIFRRRYYFRPHRVYCMIVTTKPLKQSALRLSLSRGVCVIQPMASRYGVLLRRLAPGMNTSELMKTIPVFFPPEVIWNKLNSLDNTCGGVSETGLELAYTICKDHFSKSIESLPSISDCERQFDTELKINRDIFKKLAYLSAYVDSLLKLTF